jgi:DNA (cytosine-5)-methyltransferase 1
MDKSSNTSPINLERIKYLFDNDLYELPNEVRPDCHKDGNSYPSVYGRLSWNKPAPTITTGFLSPGRGRYIHPTQMRCITPREAARIQGFPDWFNFSSKNKDPIVSDITKWIGDAVPSVLGFTSALAALTSF